MPTRNRNGMGTVVKRSDGRYQAAVYVLQPNDHRRRRYVYGSTWEEANNARLSMLDANRKGVPSITSTMRLDAYLDHWLNTVAQHELRPSTFAAYQTLITYYLKPKLGAIKLNRLSPNHVRTFLREVTTEPGRKGRPLAARSVRFIHAVLRSALAHAVREELLGRNVATLVSAPKITDTEVIPLDHDGARRFLHHAGQHWLAALWLLLITTGLRRGEALAIAWSDLDLQTGTLRIRRSLQRIHGQLVFGEPKTRRSRRTLVLPRVCRDALIRHRTTTAERTLTASWNPLPHQPDDLVFITRTGRPVDPRSINRALATLCARANIDPTRVHDLRHTCASLLLSDGANPREIMELLGHSTIGVTMNVYAHILDEAKQALAGRMDTIFGDGDD